MYITQNAFASSSLLLDQVQSCVWPKTESGDEKDLILCTQWPESQRKGDANERDASFIRLVSSRDFFFSKTGLDLRGGVVGLSVIKSFIVAAVVSFGPFLFS